MLGNSYSKESKLASAALLGYLERTQMTGLERITKIIPFAESEYMSLDFSAKRNLELTETLHEKKRYGSLLWVLDKCETSMGKRPLKSFIEKTSCKCWQNYTPTKCRCRAFRQCSDAN